MKTFTLDLETEPRPELVDMYMKEIKVPKSYTNQDTIDLYLLKKRRDLVKKMSVDVDACQIKCIGLKEDDQPGKIVTLEEFIDIMHTNITSKPEPYTDFAQRKFTRLVTFNGKKFDLPIIIRACLRRKFEKGDIKKKYQDTVVRKLVTWCKRNYSTYLYDGHIDIYELIQGGDPKTKSLDKYASIYLKWPKKDIDFVTCTMKELHDHCTDDVDMTYALFIFAEVLLVHISSTAIDKSVGIEPAKVFGQSK